MPQTRLPQRLTEQAFDGGTGISADPVGPHLSEPLPVVGPIASLEQEHDSAACTKRLANRTGPRGLAPTPFVHDRAEVLCPWLPPFPGECVLMSTCWNSR